jgi:protein phosphatase PTC7
MKYKFKYGVIKIPHFSKIEKGGEDAFSAQEGMICVADGVGGWNESGIDPSKYSNELCEKVKEEYLKNCVKLYANPKEIFNEACSKVRAIGTSTFCMCILDFEKKHIHSLNLGDSGYMLIRGKNKSDEIPNKSLNKNQSETFDVIFKSEEQQHSFNFPYQVGTNGDNPNEADIFVNEFEENDIIVLGSDGLWDNLYENQILNVIKPFYEKSSNIGDLNLLAKKLGQICESYSLDVRNKSPFWEKSKGLYLGGKPDDITIIVAQIVKNELI